MKNSAITSVGICLGASTLSLVEVKEHSSARTIVNAISKPHLGDIRSCLLEILKHHNYPQSLNITITGRKIRHAISLSSIAEPLAVELAIRQILPAGHSYRSVVSAGGENFILYHLDNSGCITEIHTGSKCASGTGEFFLQQLRRMDLTLEEATSLGFPAQPYAVSGRCAVFCKSDCTHALNKGVAKAAVVAGLGRMMAEKIDDLFGKLKRQDVILVGGCTRLSGMVYYLQEKINNLLIPKEATCFEALGAACWAMDHDTQPLAKNLDDLFIDEIKHFSCNEPLEKSFSLVHRKSRRRDHGKPGDHCILGLDVGSTTTKGVIMRRRDKAVLASSYLRTSGDPVTASRQVYAALHRDLSADLLIDGLGVTGSGRQIAARHAMASGVINEIIAHATAATFYDPSVDTIFEIGGQDAKYTYLVNGVPQDYAMNEACSAGTGSFLEESAKESLDLDVEAIGDIACHGDEPPNFSDQCAAFIGSDIKNAIQQGINRDNIVAGLVYSVCQNYINRVIGNRPIGKKIFVQGGVCYNKAVPAALAALTGKEVVVPPEPGLMGAFGVALEIDKRLAEGRIHPASFDLAVLASRRVAPMKSFFCKGGKERCDNKCEISLITVDGRNYPFGGICNRYDNLKSQTGNAGKRNLVAVRQQLIFSEGDTLPEGNPTIGMNRSFLVNSYQPFYRTFFATLGYRLVLPEDIDAKVMVQHGATFCFPAEIAHGYMANLLREPTDATFLPHFKGLPALGHDVACTCVFVQSEPYYLRAAFPEMNTSLVLSPVIDFSKDLRLQLQTCSKLALELGRSRKQGVLAFERASAVQEKVFHRLQQIGTTFLTELEKHPEEKAVVLFGRPYSAFASEANKGIPLKFAARGVRIIPFDMLPFADEALPADSNMYWGMGNMLLKCATLVARHRQLFGVFISNFSCGPDSFIITYLRDAMGEKPSLTLELDNHTADAGIETRIEAFLDIISVSSKHYSNVRNLADNDQDFVPATIYSHNHRYFIRSSASELVPLTDPRVKIVIPAMSKYGSPLLAKAFARAGIRATALPPADAMILRLGKEHSTCKECLPLQTTTGSILNYLHNDRPKGELTIYFMPSAPGPCRFGQYSVFTKRLIAQEQFRDIAVLSPHSENCYGGLTGRTAFAALRAVVIGDLFDEMWATLLAGAAEVDNALALLDSSFRCILNCIDQRWSVIAAQLKQCAFTLGNIPLSRPYVDIPKISLIGEIYVRHDPISLQHLVERLARRGFIVRTAPNVEWFKYLDWLIKNGILGRRTPSFWLRHFLKEHTMATIKRLLAPSGLIYDSDMDIEAIVRAGSRYISTQLQGETILTVGSAFHDILNPACGIISLGPFGCMPSRVAEAILKEKFSVGEKRALSDSRSLAILSEDDTSKFPFLTIETDGNPFPQIIEARLEAFCLQAERLHQRYFLGKGQTRGKDLL